MKPRIAPLCAALALPLLGACTDESSPTAALDSDAPVWSAGHAAAPTNLAMVSFGGSSSRIWPYTDTNFEASPQDPINLVFVGRADTRNIRSALLSLDNNRSGFIQAGPSGMLLAGLAQGCTWQDAVGGNQTNYSAEGGWSGSVIQLECGSFNGFRFHVRLFPAGQWAVANAHAEVLIPGTNHHEVLTWEAAEKFVMMELARSGLLAAAPSETGIINEAGSFGTIRTLVYNGFPDNHPLRMLSQGPLTGSVGAPVPVATDGKATVLALRDAPPAGGTTNSFVISFGQVIPKPFCAQPGELVRVDGPVRVNQVVSVSSSGVLESRTLSEGTLTVRSFNPAMGQMGPAVRAEVEEEYEAEVRDKKHRTWSKGRQRLMPDRAPPQQFSMQLKVGSNGQTVFHADEVCGS